MAISIDYFQCFRFALRSLRDRSACAEEPNPLTPFPVKEGGTEKVGSLISFPLVSSDTQEGEP